MIGLDLGHDCGLLGRIACSLCGSLEIRIYEMYWMQIRVGYRIGAEWCATKREMPDDQICGGWQQAVVLTTLLGYWLLVFRARKICRLLKSTLKVMDGSSNQGSKDLIIVVSHCFEPHVARLS